MVISRRIRRRHYFALPIMLLPLPDAALCFRCHSIIRHTPSYADDYCYAPPRCCHHTVFAQRYALRATAPLLHGAIRRQFTITTLPMFLYVVIMPFVICAACCRAATLFYVAFIISASLLFRMMVICLRAAAPFARCCLRHGYIRAMLLMRALRLHMISTHPDHE